MSALVHDWPDRATAAIEPLTGSNNFATWKRLMASYLKAEPVWDAVSGDPRRPDCLFKYAKLISADIHSLLPQVHPRDYPHSHQIERNHNMSRRTTVPERPSRPITLGSCIAYGCGAGLLGVAAMTVGEKIEQRFTGRPSSYVPGHTLERLLSLRARPDPERFGLNMAMHYGQGAAAAIIRALMSANGVRGPFSDFIFLSVRLLIDQTLENATGVGALPWTWPVNEQVIDILHKAVFAFVTGYFTDRWLQR